MDRKKAEAQKNGRSLENKKGRIVGLGPCSWPKLVGKNTLNGLN
jgi:hypothetical protein